MIKYTMNRDETTNEMVFKEDGHAMFNTDVLKALKRLSYLEEWKKIRDGRDNIIRLRFSYWRDSRGSYVLNNKYLQELEEFMFTGESKTLCNFEEYLEGLYSEATDNEDYAND